MKAESILQILQVRAVEAIDPRGETLPWPEREQATRLASAELGGRDLANDSTPLNADGWRFLARRAGILHAYAPDVFGEVPPVRYPKALGVGLCGCAFGIGWMAHGAGLSHTFDLLAGPFLLVLLWNGIVYLLLLWERFHPSEDPGKIGDIARLADRLNGRFVTKPAGTETTTSQARLVTPWLRSWWVPSMIAWFHAASACFTLGLLAAIYFRGLLTAYVASWESTWLDAHGVGLLLGTLLRPASWLTGIAMPDSNSAWDLLRRSATHDGVSAAPWIHLYAVTLCGLVIFPRLVLASVAGIRAARNRHTPPAWNNDDPYLRRIFSSAKTGGNFSIAVLPFDFKRPATLADGTSRDAIERLLRETWGLDPRSAWQPRAAYGDEDSIWENAWSSARDGGGALLLFDAHATPEIEVHGTLLDAAWTHFSHEPGGLLVALETAEFDPRRLDSRINAWTQLADSRGFKILPLAAGASLDPTHDASTFLRRMA